MVFSSTPLLEATGDGNESSSSGEDSFIFIDEEDERNDADQEPSNTETFNSEDVDVNQETLENKIVEAIRQAGLDDKFWIKKFREEFKVESIEELKNVTKEQVEVFLQNTETAIALRLRPVFSKLIGIDALERESAHESELSQINLKEGRNVNETDSTRSGSEECGDGDVEKCEFEPENQNNEVLLQENQEKLDNFLASVDLNVFPEPNISVSEVLRLVENSVVCRGICFSQDMEKLVAEKELVIHGNSDVLLGNVLPQHSMCHQKFTSRELMHRFIDHIDKNASISEVMNIFGLDFVDIVGCAGAADSFVGSVHYQLVPVVLVQLLPHALRPEVISVLQNVEGSLKLSDYLPGNHFEEFFEKYGSHFCSGVVELGGILVATAECSGFKEENRIKLQHMASTVSEMAFLLGFNEKIQPGQTYRAEEVLEKVPDLSAEDLSHITVTIKKIGGSQDAEEKDIWKEKLRKDDGNGRLSIEAHHSQAFGK